MRKLTRLQQIVGVSGAFAVITGGITAIMLRPRTLRLRKGTGEQWKRAERELAEAMMRFHDEFDGDIPHKQP